MATKFYAAISHIGGADGDLDAISSAVLTDGDGAVVIDAVNDTLSMYTLLGTSSEVNDAVNFTYVKPTDAATPGKRWKQVEILTFDLAIGGTLTSVDADFTGDVTADTLELGGAGVVATDILDENDMATNSATALASQQSIKAYVDAQVTAQDLDIIGDTGGALSIDLDSETLTLAGGTGIASVGGTNTITFNIDSTVATLTGSQTLTNKTLTDPTILAKVGETAIDIAADGAVGLRHNNIVKFATSATGGTLTGDLAVSQVTGLDAPVGTGEAIRTTATITELNLIDLTDTGATTLHTHAHTAEFASGVKMFFSQASAPTGWTLDATSKDNVLATKADAGTYSVIGANKGSWTYTGFTKDAHTHTGPEHTHQWYDVVAVNGTGEIDVSGGADAGTWQSDGSTLEQITDNGDWYTKNAGTGATGAQSDAAITHSGADRPYATVGIIATKD